MCSSDTLRTMLSDLRAALIRIYGDELASVILYGSYARGDYDDGSDVDVMVLVNGDDDFIERHENELTSCVSSLCLEYDIVLSINVKSKSYFDYWKDGMPYFRNIALEGVEIGA